MRPTLAERKLTFSQKEQEVRLKRFGNAVLKRYPKIRLYTGNNYSYSPFINRDIICVYLTACKELKLDPFDLLPLESMRENRKENILENRLLAMYCSLNREGRKRIMEMFEDICGIEKYRMI